MTRLTVTFADHTTLTSIHPSNEAAMTALGPIMSSRTGITAIDVNPYTEGPTP